MWRHCLSFQPNSQSVIAWFFTGEIKDYLIYKFNASINAYAQDPETKEVKQVYEDDGIRFLPNRGSSSKLKTVFKKNCIVTARNASQITDDAGAVILASAEAVKKCNSCVLARILSRVCVGSDPLLMLGVVIREAHNALKKVNLNLNDIDLFEVNEAFAVVACAWQKTSGFNWDKININRAHCHTLGATGAILTTKVVIDLEYNEEKYGLQTMCIGWGMATSTVIERCNK